MPRKLGIEYAWAIYRSPSPGFSRRWGYLGQDGEKSVMARGSLGSVMRHNLRVSRAVSRLQRMPGGKLERLKRPLLEAEAKDG